MKASRLALSLVGSVSAYPFIADMDGLTNKHLISRQQSGGTNPGGPASCPFNPDHVDAQGSTAQYPYMRAKYPVPGIGVGGYQVPAPGDTAHQYIAPTETDIRGPCPGLNAMANHNFLARDGITNYGELVDGVQNVYNMAYDLANFLSVVSVYIADGDITTTKLSIGCDATTRTSINPSNGGSEPGLDGHNKFELDTSLTRDDFFLGDGDNYSFNGTLFSMMVETTGGIFDFDGLSKYRFQRYQQSRVENSQMYFGLLGLFLHGAASFVYELFPNGNQNYVPNLETISTFFGADQQADGTYAFVPERIPDNWTNRKTPYTLLAIAGQILEMYGRYPVGIGGNVDGNFVGIDFPPYIQGGNVTAKTPAEYACLLYQLVSGPFPSSLNGIISPTEQALQAALSAIGGDAFTNLGCPIPIT